MIHEYKPMSQNPKSLVTILNCPAWKKANIQELCDFYAIITY